MRSAGTAFCPKHHLARCPKYRRQLLVPPIDVRPKDLIAVIAAENEMTARTMEAKPDKFHLFVEFDPTLCVAEPVNRM